MKSGGHTSSVPTIEHHSIGCDVRVHDLKTWPDYFRAIERGDKTFEVRKDDGRGFRVGDVLRLREWDPDTGEYTGRWLRAHVTYKLSGSRWFMNADVCVMAIRLEQAEAVQS